MRLLIGIAIGVAIARLYWAPQLQKNGTYLEKEKYLLAKLKKYCPQSLDESAQAINDLQ